jgi:hypothetical protein
VTDYIIYDKGLTAVYRDQAPQLSSEEKKFAGKKKKFLPKKLWTESHVTGSWGLPAFHIATSSSAVLPICP